MATQVRHNISLKDRTTFHVDVNARHWADFSSPEELVYYYRSERWTAVPKLVLSGGSNVLLLSDFPGLVLHPAIRGIEVVAEEADSVLVRAGAGEKWDDFVSEAVRRGWHGIENLSWIPGYVGTSPIQNIGAYGVEAGDVVEKVEYWDRKDGKSHVLENRSCGFAYRDSVFKQALRDRAVVTHVLFRLRKAPGFVLTYPDLNAALSGETAVTLARVREAVIRIRKQKLPDPAQLGNAGSFFKNPRVDAEVFQTLKMRHPEIPGFFLDDGGVKIPAGWLVQRCGWKGFREKDVGVFEDHALILVNHGRASGRQILTLAEKIEASVADRFGIRLEPEVTILT